MNQTGGPLCVCGHRRVAHEHYRAGTDCSSCLPGGCPRFRSAGTGRTVLRRLGRALRRPPSASRAASTGRDGGQGRPIPR